MFCNIQPYVKRQLLITACLNIGHILVGYEIYWTGPIIPKLLNIEETPLSRVISATEASWVASLVLIGGDVGNEEAAKESLHKLGRDKDIDTELKKMMEQAVKTKTNSYLLRELFIDKGNRRALCVTIPLYIFQQSSGNIAVIFFATTIFNSAGSSIQPHIATMIVGATSLFSAIFSPMFIDKHGRRILLIISTAGCCASMVSYKIPVK
ncbi:hypothetical protein O3G_MSEX015048 [Manduca sexta]|uniref:Uncharacterized protein n=1 Tax=Manduca sexta TaxID=7130 RepID=A0A921ZWA5_MANSE|nr:hypothetical protein O3G_MSEX015048 [Manduca sexta]